MDKDNQYNQSSKDKFCNSSINFSESAHAVTNEEREAALERIQKLADYATQIIKSNEQ